MTKTFAVDENNDLYLDDNGNIAIVTGQIALLQICQQAAQTLLGEMVLQANHGIPYFQVVFNGSPNVQQFGAALRTAWLAITGVIQIVSLEILQNANNDSNSINTLNYTAVIQTIYGTGEING